MITASVKKIVLLLVTSLCLLSSCEDDPIISPTGDGKGDGGSYGSIELESDR